MVPLAATSTAWAIRKLGGKRWQLLHRLIYFSALCGVIHFYWLVKSDITRPLLYGAILLTLMLFRAAIWIRPKPGTAPARACFEVSIDGGASFSLPAMPSGPPF